MAEWTLKASLSYIYIYIYLVFFATFFGLPKGRFGKRHSTFLEGVDATCFGIRPLLDEFMALTGSGPAHAQHYRIGLTHVEGLTSESFRMLQELTQRPSANFDCLLRAMASDLRWKLPARTTYLPMYVSSWHAHVFRMHTCSAMGIAARVRKKRHESDT